MRNRGRLILFVGFVLLSVLACGGGERSGRVLLIGIDGATLRVAGPLLEQGRLPNLERIAAQGVSGPLRSLQPLASPLIWNSIATGKTPEKHGITAFSRSSSEGGDVASGGAADSVGGAGQELFLSSDRRVHALWNIASRVGKEVAVLNFWNTYPVERVRGVMVSDHLLVTEIEGREAMTGASSPRGGDLIYPVEAQKELLSLFGDSDPVVEHRNPFEGDVTDRLATLSEFFRHDERLVRLALRIEEQRSPDLLMVLLPGIDRVSHTLWSSVEPPEAYAPEYRPTDEERAVGVEALESYYVYTDALIGKLVERFGADDLVLVVSDHGFEAGIISFGRTSTEGLTGMHLGEKALDGVLFARGPDVRPGELATEEVSVLDLTPTILCWWGLPLGEDMDGQPAPFLEGCEPTRIATWDTEPVERASPVASGAEDELLEELRSLGYIE